MKYTLQEDCVYNLHSGTIVDRHTPTCAEWMRLIKGPYLEDNMLHTDDLWEDVEGTAVQRALSNQPGLRQFWCVEVPVNVQLFHLDVKSRLRDETTWSRLIFDNIRRIVPILRGSRPGDVRLSLQTRRIDHSEYKILPVRKVISGTIAPGFENYAFICGDGAKYFESAADLSIGPFTDERVIWASIGSGL